MMNVCVDVSLRVLWGIHQVSAVGLTRSRLCAPIQMCSFIDAASRCKLLSDMLDALHVGVPAQSHGAALGGLVPPWQDMSRFPPQTLWKACERLKKTVLFIKPRRHSAETK